MNLKQRIARLECDQDAVGAPSSIDLSWLSEEERDEYDAILVAAAAAGGLTDELKRRVEALEDRWIRDLEEAHRTA